MKQISASFINFKGRTFHLVAELSTETVRCENCKNTIERDEFISFVQEDAPTGSKWCFNCISTSTRSQCIEITKAWKRLERLEKIKEMNDVKDHIRM